MSSRMNDLTTREKIEMENLGWEKLGEGWYQTNGAAIQGSEGGIRWYNDLKQVRRYLAQCREERHGLS